MSCLANSISYLQRKYYLDEQLKMPSYVKNLRVLESHITTILKSNFPELYNQINELKKIYSYKSS